MMKKHGGARPNAGRRRGGQNEKTRVRKEYAKKVFEKLESEGVLPLEVMAELMREYWTEGKEKNNRDLKEKAGLWAKECAQFFHPKLANTQHSGDPDAPMVTEIHQIIVDPTHDDAASPSSAQITTPANTRPI